MENISVNISERRFDPILNRLCEKELEFEREAFLRAFTTSEETLKTKDTKAIGCSVYVGTVGHTGQMKTE